MAHQTHSAVSLRPTYAAREGILDGVVLYHHVLTINLASYHPSVDDFDPSIMSNRSHFWREWRWARDCECDADERCGLWIVSDAEALPDVSSGARRLSSDGAMAWRLFTMSPSLLFRNATGGTQQWTLLGELDKVVSVSSLRFTDVEVEEAVASATVYSVATPCLAFRINGSAAEEVHVTAIGPSGRFVNFTFKGDACLADDGGAAPCRMCERQY